MPKDYALKPSRRAEVDFQIDYEKELNCQQWAAAACPPGPALIIAGAGSGKTRTLTYRVAYLIERGVAPRQILLLTFTNKAAREMMGRVASLLGQELLSIWGGTFHSIGNRILRRHAPAIGYSKDFTIMDREDAQRLLSDCMATEKIDLKVSRFPKPKVVASLFSQAANQIISVTKIVQERFGHFEDFASQLEALHRRYRQRKKEGGLMDFDDLLACWLELFDKDEETRQRYQQQFRCLLVDEYQDTNKLQGRLIDRLAEGHQNVMAVGDDAQSIYSWRGADFTNILEFPKRYPAAKLFKIETNYRSTPEILQLANAAIAANGSQFKKTLRPARGSGLKPAVVFCSDADEQAAFIAQRVLELREEGAALSDMAVLYRSHFHAMEVQLELARCRIPFAITSGIRFFEQAHIKDAAAYLKLAANPRDEPAFKRLVRMLPGIGLKVADNLWGRFGEQLSSQAQLPTDGQAEESSRAAVAACLANCAPAVPKKSQAAWAQMSATIAQIETPAMRRSPGKMIELVLDAGYEEYLQVQFENYRSRLEEVHQLAQYAHRFESAEDFLAQLALETNFEAEERAAETDGDDRLRLTTIHQAKGLEFSTVFIIMLCEGFFPSSRSQGIPEAEEEERRLFYVAVTRAKDQLYLSFPGMRFAQGRQGVVHLQPSPFLRELPESVYESWNLRSINNPF